MTRLALLLVLCVPGVCPAAGEDAVVRIHSHGCSGTVIYTTTGRTLVLTCAHAFEGRDRDKPLRINAPHPRPGAVSRGGSRVIRCDYKADLCLIEMATGPMPYVCPVARSGHRPVRYRSCGYDEMKYPMTNKAATVLGIIGRSGVQYTREKPWHGRSGGALLDPDSGVLLGTVIGYEVGGGGRGMYTSHAAVLRFLGYTTTKPTPRYTDDTTPEYPLPPGTVPWDAPGPRYYPRRQPLCPQPGG